MAKYFATIVRDAESRQRASRHQKLLSYPHDVDQLRRIRVEINQYYQLPWRPVVPVFIATATSACAKAGASFVPVAGPSRPDGPFP